jgi:hypothetical protein
VEERDCGRLRAGAKRAQHALKLLVGRLDQRVVALPRRQPHQPRGGLLAAAVDLQDLLVLLYRLFRLVVLDQPCKLFERVEVALLERRTAPIDPQRGARRGAWEKVTLVECNGPLKLLTACGCG